MLMTLSAMRCLSGSLSEENTCWSMFDWLLKSVIVHSTGGTVTNKRVQVQDCGLRVDGSKHLILSESSGNVDIEVFSRKVF